jgi:IclR family pca regulon transcriptional regulator
LPSPSVFRVVRADAPGGGDACRKSMPDPLPDESSAAPRPGDAYVQSFARGLAVLRSFGADAPAQTLSTAAARSGMTRAGARRILLTLQQLGYVEAEGRLFRLTPKVMELGFAYLSSQPVWHLAQPVMEELVQDIHESSSAAVLDGTDIVYVLRVPANKIMAISLGPGSRLPAYCTSMGRVLLAGLPRPQLALLLGKRQLPRLTRHTVTDPKRLLKLVDAAREQQWALVCEELEEGLVSLSVPILDRSGHCVAAMNISSQLNRTPPDFMVEHFLPKLKAAAAEISSMLRVKA